MNVKRLIAIIFGGLLIGFFLGVLNVQVDYWMFVFLVFIAFVLFSYRDVRYMFLSRDVEKIEKYLQKKSVEPYYDFIVQLANKNMGETKKALEKLEQKWKKKERTAVFRANYYLYMKDWKQLKEEITFIPQEEFKHYFLAAIAIEEKNESNFAHSIQHIRKDWMKLSLEAEKAKKEKNEVLAEQKQLDALRATKGIQYYILSKSFD